MRLQTCASILAIVSSQNPSVEKQIIGLSAAASRKVKGSLSGQCKLLQTLTQTASCGFPFFEDIEGVAAADNNEVKACKDFKRKAIELLSILQRKTNSKQASVDGLWLEKHCQSTSASQKASTAICALFHFIANNAGSHHFAQLARSLVSMSSGHSLSGFSECSAMASRGANFEPPEMRTVSQQTYLHVICIRHILPRVLTFFHSRCRPQFHAGSFVVAAWLNTPTGFLDNC
jgi:hypothetical protein